MAESTQANLIEIFHEQFFAGRDEVLAQNAAGFNAAGNFGITLETQDLMGQYDKEQVISLLSGLDTRRDPEAAGAATDLGFSTDLDVGVKLDRMIGPVKFTRNMWRKLGASDQVASLAFGRMSAVETQLAYLNNALSAGVASFSEADNLLTVTATMTDDILWQGLELFGDRSGSIVLWVMHSKVFFQLIRQRQTVGDTLFDLGAMQIRDGEGAIPGLGRRILVTDSAALFTSGSPNTYHTLGLTRAGLRVIQSEGTDIESDLVTGEAAGLKTRIQGEHAFTLHVNGYKWDITNGGANPTLATLETATNWDRYASDVKNTGGFAIVTDET